MDGYLHAVPSLTANRSTTPTSPRFASRITRGWAEPCAERDSGPDDQAPFTAARRRRLSQAYPGTRLVIAAGVRKRRSNDMDYPFRAHSDFAWLTGWGSETEPGAVLVFEPTHDGHEIMLFFRPSAGRGTSEFYSHAEIGEFWIGPRPSLEAVERKLAIEVRDIEDLDEFLGVIEGGAAAPAAMSTPVPTVFGGSPDPRLPALRLRLAPDRDDSQDALLSRRISELRLIKDAYEIAQLRLAVEATGRGFTDVLAELPRIADRKSVV